MANQDYSREDYDKIKLNLPTIIDAATGMKKGIVECVEIAKESNVPAYIKSAEAMESVIEKLVKAVESGIEITETVVNKYRVMDEAGMLA